MQTFRRTLRAPRTERAASRGAFRFAHVLAALIIAGCVSEVELGSDHSAREDAYVKRGAAAAPASSAIRPTDRTLLAGERGEVALGAALGCPTYNERFRECLLLKIDYVASAAPMTRPALNVALVVDRSQSMREDQKLAYALGAAHEIVRNLTERDTLSIVAVNEQATVVAAAGRVVNKPFLYHRLGEIFTSGQANLSAGLCEGSKQIQRASTEGEVRHLVLLTDAVGNRRAAGHAELQTCVQQASAFGIAVSTIGGGRNHNARLLAAMASLGGGHYAYLETPERLSTVMESLLREPLPTVAQNAVVRVTLTQGHIRKVYGQLPAPPSRNQPLHIGDLRATDRGFVLVELEPAAFAFGTTVQAEIRLDFLDPLTQKPQSKEMRLRSVYASDILGVSSEWKIPAAMWAEVLTAVELADSAARSFDLARYQQVKKAFDPLYARAHGQALQNRDQELLNQLFVLRHLVEELDEADREGILHAHERARKQLPSEREYIRYLLTHHHQ